MTDPLTRAEATGAFVHVTEVPAYREANARLVTGLSPAPDEVFLDIACGTGLVLDLVLEHVAPSATMGVDADPDMVEIARRRFGDRVRIEHGDVGDLESIFGSASVDCAAAANCVHLFDDIPGALSSIARVLKPGGRLALNTAFYAGSVPEADRPLYGQLLLEARRIARAHSSGRAPRTGRGNAVRRELTPEFFAAALDEAEFDVVVQESHTATLPAAFVIDLVTTPMFAGTVLPDVPIAVAVDAMRSAASKLANGRTHIDRSWLYFVGHKRRT